MLIHLACTKSRKNKKKYAKCCQQETSIYKQIARFSFLNAQQYQLKEKQREMDWMSSFVAFIQQRLYGTIPDLKYYGFKWASIKSNLMRESWRLKIFLQAQNNYFKCYDNEGCDDGDYDASNDDEKLNKGETDRQQNQNKMTADKLPAIKLTTFLDNTYKIRLCVLRIRM